MKQKSKIVLLSGTTAVGLSSVMGVYFGLKETSSLENEKDKKEFGEKYFKNIILNDSDFLSRNIWFGDDKDNIDELIKLDNLHYNSGKNKDFLKKDKTNLLKSDEKIVIDFSSKKNEKEIEDEFKKINSKLFHKLKELKKDKNIKGSIGVDFEKNISNSSVELKLFEVKGFNSMENALIDEFLNDLGNVEKPENGWNIHKFIRMFTSETQFDDDMVDEFNFSGGKAFANKWKFKNYSSSVKNLSIDMADYDNDSVIDPNKELSFVKRLADEKIINTIQPSIDLKNKKLKIISRFYKTQDKDEKNGLYKTIVTSATETIVYNSAAIRTEFTEYDLTEFGDLKAIEGDRKKNAEIIKEFLIGENSIAKWTDNKIVTIGLSLLKKKIPQLNSFVKRGMNLGKILNAKDESGSYKYRDLFNTDITLEINNKKVTGKIHEIILDLLQYDDLVNGNNFFEVVKQFISKEDKLMKNEIINQDFKDKLMFNFGDWNKMENLTWLDYKNGGHLKVHMLNTGLNSFYKAFIKVFNKRYPNASFDEQKDPIQELFAFLKDKKIVNDDLVISDFIRNYKNILPNILENIAKNNVSIPKNIIKNLLSIVQTDFVKENSEKLSNSLFKLFKENKFSKMWSVLGSNEEERIKTLNLLISSSTTIEGIGRILKNKEIKKESISIIMKFLKDSGLVPNSLMGQTVEEDINIIYNLFTQDDSGKTSMVELFDFIDKSIKNGISSNDLDSFKKIVSIFAKIYQKQFNTLKTILTQQNDLKLIWNDNDSNKMAENLFNFVQTGLGGEAQKTKNSIKTIIELVKLGLNKSEKDYKDNIEWFNVEKMTNLINEFLNNGIAGIKEPSFMFLTSIISQNVDEISSFYKKINLNKDVVKEIEKLMGKLSYKIINGISSLDEIKTLYDNFMNDPENSDLKTAIHKFINSKIEEKENKLKTQIDFELYEEKSSDSLNNYEKIKKDIVDSKLLVNQKIAAKIGQEQIEGLKLAVRKKYASLLKDTDKIIIKFYERDDQDEAQEKNPTDSISTIAEDFDYYKKYFEIEIQDQNSRLIFKSEELKPMKMDENWSWTKNSYIKKLSYSGYASPNGQETIDSIFKMPLMDFVNVFSKRNIIPIMKKSIFAQSGVKNYKELKESFGTLFERFKVFYDSDGRMSQNDFSKMDEVMNFLTIQALTYLVDNEYVQEPLTLVILKPLLTKTSKTLINILKSGLSGSKEEWKINIKNILDLTKEVNRLVTLNGVSDEIPDSIKKDLDKYTYEILEKFGLANKKADNSGYTLVDISTVEGNEKLNSISEKISNVFNKGINSTQSQDNLSSKEFDFIWELVKKFTSKKDENVIPDSMPKLIKKLLLDKIAFKDLTSQEITEFLNFIIKVSPGSESTINFIKNNLKNILIGNNKISLENYVNYVNSNKETILLVDNSDNKFSSHEQRIKNIIKAKFSSSKIKIEKIILSDKSVVLDKQTKIKFKVEFSRTENNIKNTLISDELECKLSEEEKYNLKNIYDIKESTKTFIELSELIVKTKKERINDRLKLNFGNDLTAFKKELDKKNYKLVLLEAINAKGQKLNAKTYLIVKKSVNSLNINLTNSNGLKLFKKLNLENDQLNLTSASLSNLQDVNSVHDKNIIFSEEKNKANNHFGIIGLVWMEDSASSDSSSIYS